MLSAAQRAGVAALPEPLPLGHSLERIFAERVSRLSSATQHQQYVPACCSTSIHMLDAGWPTIAGRPAPRRFARDCGRVAAALATLPPPHAVPRSAWWGAPTTRAGFRLFGPRAGRAPDQPARAQFRKEVPRPRRAQARSVVAQEDWRLRSSVGRRPARRTAAQHPRPVADALRRAGRRPMVGQPLRVVDHTEEAVAGRHLRDKSEHGDRDQKGVVVATRGEAERRAERCGLWPRQRVELVKYGIEQLVQRGERQGHLRLDTSPAKHPQPGRVFGCVLQQRRLPDTRLPADNQRGAAESRAASRRLAGRHTPARGRATPQQSINRTRDLTDAARSPVEPVWRQRLIHRGYPSCSRRSPTRDGLITGKAPAVAISRIAQDHVRPEGVRTDQVGPERVNIVEQLSAPKLIALHLVPGALVTVAFVAVCTARQGGRFPADRRPPRRDPARPRPG